MRVKICGITKPEQGQAIAKLGATALGFICVPQSPRYITSDRIQQIIKRISIKVQCIGVFVNSPHEQISQIVADSNLTGVQLHGSESPEFCYELRQSLVGIEVIKALRVKSVEDLTQAEAYSDCVDTLLLDAYHPFMLGGTGQKLDWSTLRGFHPNCPWFLAGGLTPDNVLECLSQVQPSGIDLSSGVEHSPGDKDLTKVAELFAKLGILDFRF